MAPDRPKLINGVPVPYGADIHSLSSLIEADGPEKWAAIAALSGSAEDGALQVLDRLVQSQDAFVRRAAMEAIGLHARGDALGRRVCEGFGDPNEGVVRAACEAAAALRIRAAYAGIRKLLRHNSADLRRQAVLDLAGFWREADFPEVFRMMRDDPDEPVRKAAAWTLRRCAHRSNWRSLFEAWRDEHPPRHRVWACELAKEFGGPEVAPFLWKLAGDKDGHVMKVATCALMKVRERGR